MCSYNLQKINAVAILNVVPTVDDYAGALWPPLIIDLIFPIAAINHPAFLESAHDKDGRSVVLKGN